MCEPKVVNIRETSEYDVYIGRPSKWGNPFHVGRDGTRDDVIEQYEAWIRSQPTLMRQCRQELKGKTLGCYCKPMACHGDILWVIANEG